MNQSSGVGRHRLFWGMGLAVAGAVVLGGCGSDDGGDAADATSPTAEAAQTAGPEATALCDELASGENSVTFADLERTVPGAAEMIASDDVPA